MAQELIISISGMRGLIGENLTPAIAAEYGAAFGTFLKQTNTGDNLKVCLGRDSRPSGQMLASAVIAGLTATGLNVVDLGIVTTPSVGVMLRKLKCAGGVVLTASHNPTPYNGIKLLLDNGIAPPVDKAERIRKIYFDRNIAYVDSTQCGRISHDKTTDSIHIENVMSLINPDAVSAKNFKVVLDSVNGAGGEVGIKLLETLGCSVTGMNIEPTGLFAHTPEPTKENLGDLCVSVKEHEADIGFAQDPDADRVAIVDENGTYIGEEYSLALAVYYVLSKMKGKPTAANLSTSRMIDDVAALFGSEVIRTPVGEANVAEAMIQHECVIGGEGNGGVIDLRVGPIRDSLVGMALILQLMAETGKTVSELVQSLKKYHMVKTKAAADKSAANAIIEKAKTVFSNAQINSSDGCRFDMDDGWIHIRTSNTEPIMRIIVETETEQAAKNYIDQISQIRESLNI